MYDLWVNYPAIPAQEAAVSGALRGLLEGGAPCLPPMARPRGRRRHAGPSRRCSGWRRGRRWR
ncbi:hypothetical protein [Teichococcus aestuarii]|uniref:hypothetical protein n=1 Tax=Teichococcus aestuarii TaxID=568898 RepID=UPI0036102523